MPRDIGDFYFRDEADFNRALTAFNALFNLYDQWQVTRARKEHEDLFGEPIQPGEFYYKQQTGPAWDQVTKLSQLSMERVLYVVLVGNSRLQALGERELAERQSQMRADHDRYSPVNSLLGPEDEEPI